MSDRDLSVTSLLAPVGSMDGPAACMAHEVSQPLSAIAVNAKCCLSSLCNERPDVEKARKAVERIVRNVQHASAVIRSVATLHGTISGEVSPVHLNSVICDAAELMSPEIVTHGVAIEVELCREAVCVLGHRTQLQQVLINLIGNAIDAMRETRGLPRTLRLCSSIDDAGDVSIAVSDTGPGLDPATAGRIFEPFFTTKTHGTGLGLAICRSIVLGHGGRLRVRPRMPHGCTFEFTLPAHKCEIERRTPSGRVLRNSSAGESTRASQALVCSGAE